MQQNNLFEIFSSTDECDEQVYTFIDLFAGIGGFHFALKQLNMECVFASEIDKYARETYSINHDITSVIFNDDIRKIEPSMIAEHDILCAGFPCQPFSQAGYKKGFEDGDKSERGNLFFVILDILEAKRPKAFILENVRHLLNHDGGATFTRIKEELLNINYTVDYKIIKASDFGIPQHRPRIFIVGFDKLQIDTSIPFEFPNPIPLTKNMSDIWGGKCHKEIGFTLRVGGKGSNINDRRNWDSYLVDGEVKRIGVEQAKKMMGYPEDFILPVSRTQAMKQLGNSVCTNVVYHVAKKVKQYLNYNVKKMERYMAEHSFNKGEWSEIYAFLSLLSNNQLFFGDLNSTALQEFITVVSIGHNGNEYDYINKNSCIQVVDKNNIIISSISLEDLFANNAIQTLFNDIKNSSGSSFQLPNILDIMQKLLISKFKGSANSKGDFIISFNYNGLNYPRHAIGVKSYIGNPPTLLNSSSATNFLFEIENFTLAIDSVNNIRTRSKIKDRIDLLRSSGAFFKFIGCESKIHEDNLRKVDSMMPEILSNILIDYYSGHGNKLVDLINDHQKQIRLKDYLKAIVLGMFSSCDWNGSYSSEGYILVKKEGDMILYHVIKDSILKDYLFNNTKLDTPSSTRHRFGNIYKENGRYFMKLNLQIRMI